MKTRIASALIWLACAMTVLSPIANANAPKAPSDGPLLVTYYFLPG